MKIGIYSQPSGPVLGGTDVAVAVLAEALADSHAVEVLHHAEQLSAEQLGAFSGTDLSRVTLRRVSRTSRPDHEPLNPYSRLRGERRREAEISEGYDLFIPFTHEPPPFCHARYGLISVLFPTSSPLHRDGRTPTTLWGAARRMYSAVCPVRPPLRTVTGNPSARSFDSSADGQSSPFLSPVPKATESPTTRMRN